MTAPTRGRPLVLGGLTLFDAPDVAVETTSSATGAFLRCTRPSPAYRFEVTLGRLLSVRRHLALYRYDPFWVKPRAGRRVDEIPVGTEFLLAELESGGVLLVAPLVKAPFYVSLEGRGAELFAVADSGDPATLGRDALLAYVAVGSDPHALVRESAREVARELGTVGLRREQQTPDFIDDFGWCTWDAFYQDVSHDKVADGLASFRQGGVEPRVLILDDGWQEVSMAPTGERRLVGLGTNEKFPGGLAPTVKLAKDDFGVKRCLVWHAVHGYWGGLAREALPEYAVTDTLRWNSPEILAHRPQANTDWVGASVGRPAPAALLKFYDDYHSRLARAGVDGVKVDNQASIDGLSHGIGGRVEIARATRAALEASVARHFAGRLIACMSCSSALVYHTACSGVTRSSTDFWPNRPESHGLHGYTNAVFSLWFGEFTWPDWDMFQSGHAAGAYHAALRAVSGGSVYVSDKPDGHDFALLEQLVLSDGSVLRARSPGLPTRDCLFEDVLEAPVLLKIWNENEGSGVVGAFHARSRGSPDPIIGAVSPADVPTLSGDDFALYFHAAKRLVRSSRTESHPLTLDTLGAEVVTIVPVDHGVAAVGLVDKLNGGAAVRERGWVGATYRVSLRDGGRFMALSERAPRRVLVDGRETKHARFEAAALELELERGGARVVELVFD
jgi:raffinose synthase